MLTPGISNPSICDASVPVLGAADAGNCTSFLAWGASCTNTPQVGEAECSPSTCVQGELRPGKCATRKSSDGSLRGVQTISAAEKNGDLFGSLAVNVGDFDGDSIPDLAVGSPGDGNGAVYILAMNSDGTMKSQLQKSIGYV